MSCPIKLLVMFVYFVRAMELNYRPIVRLTFVGWSVDYTLTGTNEGMWRADREKEFKLRHDV
jgi:hypothetical protein